MEIIKNGLLFKTHFLDTNTNLSDGNKMHYLRNSLTGEALRVINRLPVTDANYKIAMKALTERFQNKRSIVNASLSSFINQPKMEERTTEQIRSLIDTTRDALECIESLGVSTDEWSPFIVFIMQSKMDDVTKHEYEKYLGGATELPKYKLMKVFLEREFRVIDSSNVSINTRNIGENVNLNAIPPPTPPRSFNDNKYKNQANQNAGSANQAKQQSYSVEKCPLCSENHWLLNCQQFIDRTPIQRKEFAESKNICIKCLHAHEKDQCKSKYQCKICKGPHSVKLHTVYDDVPQSSTTVAAIQETNSVFATALVNVHDKFGAKHLLRVFIDMGSGGAFVSERAAQLLCLPRKREIKDLTGLDGAPLGKSTNSVRLQVESLHDDSFKLAIDECDAINNLSAQIS